MAIVSIPKPLREKLGEEGTDALVQVLNENGKDLRSSVIDFAEQRFEQSVSREIALVRVDLADTEKRLMGEIAGVRVDLADAEKRFEKRLTEEIAGVRVAIADLRGSIQIRHNKMDVSILDRPDRSSPRHSPCGFQVATSISPLLLRPLRSGRLQPGQPLGP